MEKIYVISEECHGEVIYASSREKAIEALISTNWIGGYCEFWDYKTGERICLKELHPNWQEWLKMVATDADFESLGFCIYQVDFYK